jgi:hypothetical protein
MINYKRIGSSRPQVTRDKKNTFCCVFTPCGSCKNQSFAGTYRLHHQGDKNPNADKEAVVKKINASRTNYIRENKNFEESHHSGSGTDEICVPTLWY